MVGAVARRLGNPATARLMAGSAWALWREELTESTPKRPARLTADRDHLRSCRHPVQIVVRPVSRREGGDPAQIEVHGFVAVKAPKLELLLPRRPPFEP